MPPTTYPTYPIHPAKMSSSPTPTERENKDKEDRAREAEEQTKLPYKWTQTIQDLDITVAVPSNLRGKDIVVDMTKTKLKVGVKGQEPFIDVRAVTDYFLYEATLSCVQLPLILLAFAGSSPPRNPPLRIHLDARAHLLGQRHLHPPRQNQQATMVGFRYHERPLPPRYV